MPAVVLVAAAVGVTPVAVAQQASTPWLPLPRPADRGKAVIYSPEFLAKEYYDRAHGCTPGLQCRFRLVGVIENNGAVELRATAFTW